MSGANVAEPKPFVTNSYAVGTAIILILALGCFYVCYKSMDTNRGNLINLPTWRKAVKTACDLLLYALVGVFLWRGDAGAIIEAIEIIFAMLITIVVFCWGTLCLRSYWSGPQRRRTVLSKDGIPDYRYVLTKGVVEYIFYAVCRLSKYLIVALTAILCGWQVVYNIWREKLVLVVGEVNVYLLEPLTYCLYICFAAALIFSVVFIAMVLGAEQLTEASEVSSKLEREKWKIRHNFRAHEHDV